MKKLFILVLVIGVSAAARADFTCAVVADALNYTIPLSAPLALSTWNNAHFSDAVYNTNLPGIGIAIWLQLVPATTANPVLVWSGTRLNVTNIPVTLAFGYSLIKIANVLPGAVSGISLPTFGLSLQVTPNVVGFPRQATTYNFSGAINVVANTCETPDINMDTGSWHVSDFGSVGKTTKLIKSIITLRNCPTFSGYYFTNAINNYTNGSVGSGTARDANLLTVSIAPCTQLIDATNGIMAIESGGSAASGIGIQLGWGSFNSTPGVFNFNQTYTYTPSTSGVTSFDIPLSARYIQTASVPTPGRTMVRRLLR